MEGVIKYKRFSNNGSLLREKENLTYTVFEELDFMNHLPQISFFRSDFRGSRFVNVSFYKNNFDRADFISAIFENCLFREVAIAACEMKNCYFNNSKFTLNTYANTSIQECTFENCTFENEKFLVNMKNCRFINCTLKNCTFERSTTEKMEFTDCEILKTDLATMHAENYSFKSCNLEDVSLGISYIFGYLFYKTDISRLYTLYRGDKIKISSDSLSEYIISLLEEQRFFEFLNTNIFLFKSFQVIPELFNNALNQLSQINNTTRRLEIVNLLDMFSFYILNNQLPYKLVCKILNILDEFDWTLFPFDEQILYMSMHKKIEMIITNFQYDNSFIESAIGSTQFITFRCKTNDYQEALKITSSFLDDIHAKLGLNKNYRLIMKEKGSWILTFAVVSTVGLMMPKIINNYSNIYFNFTVKNKISKKFNSILDDNNLTSNDKTKAINTIQQIAKVASEAGIINQKYDTINLDEPMKKIFSQIVINP